MDFSKALEGVKEGYRFCRSEWLSKGAWIAYREFPDDGMQPFLYIKNSRGKLVPWIPTMTDLLADDWQFSPHEHEHRR